MGGVLALLAALAFAAGSVLQQKGALSTEAPEGDPHFLAEIIKKPVWLAGGLCQAAGWILQAVALKYSALVVVQSLCALSLVFALPLGVKFTNQRVGTRSVVGALATVAGIVIFVTVGQPAGGIDDPSAAAWWSATIGSIAFLAVLAMLATRRRGPTAALMFAASAGCAFAYQSAATKSFVTHLGGGLSGVLTNWSTYALIFSALAGFALQQSALKTGFLAAAMASSNATTLVLSVLLGVRLFEEKLVGAEGRGLAVLVGLAIGVIGITLLAAPEGEQPAQAVA